jgi:hypothetical protein
MFLPIAVVISVLIRLSGNYGFWYVIQYSKLWGLVSPIMWIAVISGLATLWVFSRLTLKKLALRDLS